MRLLVETAQLGCFQQPGSKVGRGTISRSLASGRRPASDPTEIQSHRRKAIGRLARSAVAAALPRLAVRSGRVIKAPVDQERAPARWAVRRRTERPLDDGNNADGSHVRLTKLGDRNADSAPQLPPRCFRIASAQLNRA